MEPQFAEALTLKPLNSAQFPSCIDIDQMPETPQRGSHHRRAQSETFFRFPDDLLFDADDFNLSSMDIPSMSEENDTTAGAGFGMAVDSGKSEDENSKRKVGGWGSISHFRSLSVDSEFFDGIGFHPSPGGSGGGVGGESDKFGGNNMVQERRGHRHSFSMDGVSSSFEEDSMENVKKAMAPDRLAELTLIDPKRAKRILANRESAARSKERKIRYTSELERKVQIFQKEATTLSAQVTLLQQWLTTYAQYLVFPLLHQKRSQLPHFSVVVQRGTTDLTAENKELKLRLQAIEQQAHLRDALNDTLREEVQRLRIATGEVQPVNGGIYNRERSSAFFSQSQPLGHFHISQNHHQQQLSMPPSSANGQPLGGHPQHGSREFHQRA